MRNTHLLLILAAILITNSHLKNWYPNPAMGVDGHLGNSLFYAISGFGTALSLRRKPQSLREFYPRRLLRLYPAVILGSIVYVFILSGEWNHIPTLDGHVTAGTVALHYFNRLLYPSPYGYVTWIMIYYLAIWVVARLAAKWQIAVILLAYLPFAYFWRQICHDFHTYEADEFPYWFWFTQSFQYVIFGVWLAHYTEHLKKTRFWRESALALLMLVLYWGTKLLLKKLYLPVPAGVIVFFLMYPTIYALLRWSASADLLGYLNRRPKIAAVVAFFGGVTLEIYITQDYFQYCTPLRQLAFPLRIVVVFSVVLVASTILHLAANGVVKLVQPRKKVPAMDAVAVVGGAS